MMKLIRLTSALFLASTGLVIAVWLPGGHGEACLAALILDVLAVVVLTHGGESK